MRGGSFPCRVGEGAAFAHPGWISSKALSMPARPCEGRITYGLTWLLALTLPFEIVRPLLELRWLKLTNLELLVAATALAWGGEAITQRLRGSPGTPTVGLRRPMARLAMPALSLLLVAIVSASLAPAHRLEAVKFVTRIATGLYAFSLIACIASSRPRLVGLLWAVVLGAGLSACLGLGEVAGWRALDALLALFKATPTLVGGTLRMSASFQYATIAAMFFEMAAPLALALSATARSRPGRALALVITLICTAGVVLTLTRAGMATLALVYGLAIGLAWAHPRFRPWRWRAALALWSLALLIGGLAWRVDAFRARLATENDLNWYNAAYAAPASLTLRAGEAVTITIEARNTGQIPWEAAGERSFALGYRWLSADGRALGPSHVEISLPHDIAPGEAIRWTVEVRASVPPGEYRLAWGMLQRRVLWFRQRGVPEAETLVRVEPGIVTPIAPPVAAAPSDEAPAAPPTVRRMELWQAAWQMWAERPLLGVGPDNFRHLYGRYLGLALWDTRLHANNLYLELLADLGLAGLAVFGWLAVVAAIELARVLRQASDEPITLWAAGAGGSLLAFLAHGLLDYFLEFTSLYLLFWMSLGWIAALGSLSHQNPDVSGRR